MKIGLVSDTHGNITLLKKVLNVLREKEKISLLVHLGDDFDDIKFAEDSQGDFMRIPGVFSSYYFDPGIPNRLIKEFGEFRILFTHSPKPHPNDLPTDLKLEDAVKKRQADVVFYGHTHIPKVEIKDGLLWVNPGHLKPEDKKGSPPTYATAVFQKGKIKIDIKNALDNTSVEQFTYIP